MNELTTTEAQDRIGRAIKALEARIDHLQRLVQSLREELPMWGVAPTPNAPLAPPVPKGKLGRPKGQGWTEAQRKAASKRMKAFWAKEQKAGRRPKAVR